jgi:hypothetical protein
MTAGPVFWHLADKAEHTAITQKTRVRRRNKLNQTERLQAALFKSDSYQGIAVPQNTEKFH